MLLRVAVVLFAALSAFGWWLSLAGPPDSGGLEIGVGAGGLALVSAAAAVLLRGRARPQTTRDGSRDGNR